MKIVGIDPGVDGAIALLSGTHCPELWDVDVMNMGGNTRMMSPQHLCDLLAGWGKVNAVYLEDNRTNGNNGAKANYTMGLNIGVVIGVCAVLQRRLVRVKPREWQKTAKLDGTFRTDAERKSAHRHRAMELWPDLAESLKLQKHHNRADALLIAEHGRREMG